MDVRVRAVVRLSVLGALCLSALSATAGAYDTAAAKGAAWLSAQRNVVDGSWGATDDVKYVQTSEAVQALGALNQLSTAYHAGLSWLDNHSPANLDFTSRRILSLGQAGASVNLDLQALQSAQGTTGVGNYGWGLSNGHIGSALDTSLALQALKQQGVSTNISQAVSFLTSAQLTGTDTGWPLGQEGTSDPATTAQVIQALVPLTSVSTAVPTAITKGLTALNAKVTASSPVSQIALAAMANLKNSASSNQAVTLLNALVAQQANDGSWGNDPYATALALRALAAGLGKDLSGQKQSVDMPDSALRSAINAALGRGAMDALNVGQLQQLTTLDASRLGIKNLKGLQYATNLTYLDLSNNGINDFTPIASLNAPTIIETGNPGYVASNDNTGDTPTLPEWGAILLGGLLLLAAMRQRPGHPYA